MKKALLIFGSILLAASAHAQTNKTVDKFSLFFKANQPDSIYNLFTAQMKAAINVEGTRQLITQVKSQLGEIAGIREMDAKVSGFADFRLSFERPLVEISLVINKDSIAGIMQKPVPAKGGAEEIDSPDNYSVDNPIGKLYGTLTLPKDKKKVPVVLMIGGSGPTDRNMNQGQALRTNSFLFLAKALAENGIASFRYDKRGVGKSMAAANTSSATLDDFINDAKLASAKLAADDRFSEVIILGHSEGAAIGLITAIQTKPAAFISLCGSDTDMLTIMGVQLKPMLSSADYLIYSELADSLKAGKVVHRALPQVLASIFTPSSQSFLISTLKYNPSKEFQKLKVPVLVIGGTTDLQVPAEAATKLAKLNKKATLKIIPEMNHVLKKAPADRTSNLAAYNNTSLPLHEEVVPAITSFILSHTRL